MVDAKKSVRAKVKGMRPLLGIQTQLSRQAPAPARPDSDREVGPPTPMMRQYLETKALHPDCILFFRLGDFYEMFYEDALKGSEVLQITLTARSKGDERV